MPVSSKVTNQPARPGSHVIYFHRIRQYKDKIPEVLPEEEAGYFYAERQIPEK